MNFNSKGKRWPIIGAKRRIVQLASCAALGCGSAFAVNVPYFSDSTLGSGGTGLSGAWSGTPSLTTSRLPGAASGPYLVTAPDADRNQTVTLSLANITPGLQYNVYFSLVTIGDWVGLNGTGTANDDRIRVLFNPASESSTTYVDATFSNTSGSGNNQSFSDSTRTAGTGGTLAATTGADVKVGTPDTAANLTTSDYSVYYFGYGANAGFTFTTTAATTGTLTFQMSGLSTGATWQIGNVIVNVPEVTSVIGLSFMTLLAVGGGYLRTQRLNLTAA